MKDIIIRPTIPEDKAGILEFCKKIWEGHDYMPRVIDNWLEDKNGKMYTVLYKGKPVGLGRYKLKPGDELYLQGLRTDPDFGGKGIARAVTERIQQDILKINPRYVRTVTGRDNHASQRLIAKVFNLKRLHSFPGFDFKRPDDLPVGLLRDSTAAEIWTFIRDAYNTNNWYNVILEGWSSYRLDREIVQHWLEQGRIIAAGEEQIEAIGLLKHHTNEVMFLLLGQDEHFESMVGGYLETLETQPEALCCVFFEDAPCRCFHDKYKELMTWDLFYIETFGKHDEITGIE